MLVNNMLLPLLSETVWFDKYRYDEAERLYEERNAKQQKQVGTTVTSASTRTTAENTTSITTTKGSIAEEIAKTRQRIQNSLKNASLKTETEDLGSLNQRVQKLESETREVRALVTELQTSMKMVLDNIQQMQEVLKSQGLSTGVVAPKSGGTPQAKEQAPKSGGGDDDDDIDLFGSDEEEDEAASKLREERLKAYESKKAKKAPVVAKSSVVLDVKPWDDETDLKEMETKVREIQTDGLVWGASKLVPLAYGINKLQIMAVVEDEKVSIDWLQETIQEIEDLVQSVDIAAFNKL